jgi:hypothetical protein
LAKTAKREWLGKASLIVKRTILKKGLHMNGKKMMVCGILAIFAGLTVAPCSDQPVLRRTQPFMRQKLVFASQILEGITLERFGLVTTNAAALRDMSQTNAFLLLKNPEYLALSTNFQASVDALAEAANAKNLRAATAAYQKMTESCVECHKIFRREQFIMDRSQPAGK